jgi:hypothetical protein
MNRGNFGLNRNGHGGGAGRQANYDQARNYFKSFLQSDYVKLMSEDDESDLETWVENNEAAEGAICNIEVIQQFSSWLCDFARKSNGEMLTLGTTGDNLSPMKSVFNEIFPNNNNFNGAHEQVWYTTLRAKSSQEIIRRNFRLGVASSNKAKPIGRTQLKSINEAF